MTEFPFGSVPRQDHPAGEPPRDPRAEEREQEPGVVFRDKRRIDPETYQPRPGTADPAAPDPVGPAGTGAAAGAAADAAEEPHPLVAESERVLELTADLQRLSAEYANYRKRVDRDREAQRELTIAAVMNDVLPVLDDIGRAREHGELEGGFKAVGEVRRGLRHQERRRGVRCRRRAVRSQRSTRP